MESLNNGRIQNVSIRDEGIGKTTSVENVFFCCRCVILYAVGFFMKPYFHLVII